MPNGESKGRKELEAGGLPASPELDPAQETELWCQIDRRSAAVETLTLAKLTRVNGYLQAVDSAPLTPEEFTGAARRAVRRAIELPCVCDAHGANLAQSAHETLFGCVSAPLD